MTRKILYVSGTRADYGLMRSVLQHLARNPDFELAIAATGMHLMPEFGSTIEEIRKDGFSVHPVEATFASDSRSSMVSFIGTFTCGFTALATRLRPDMILVLGDRGEMLGSAIAGAYLGIPVVHLHGGEISATVDELARHAITKLAHLHLPATEESAARIIRMGEDPARVFVVGAPGLEQISALRPLPPPGIRGRFNLDGSLPVAIVLQHPVTLEEGDPAVQIRRTLDAVIALGNRIQAVVIYPNADSGGRAMIREIESYQKYPGIRIFPSIAHEDFLHLMSIASVLVGNSSSGIIEAPSFGLPAVNIGSRQSGREKGENVIESGYDTDEIRNAIVYALDNTEFRERVQNAKNPYGDGKTSVRIAKILKETRITPELLQKRMMY
jgi:UDP-hydrolysing UDP-N-acetyl-D-glucosamine 2-epimerase